MSQPLPVALVTGFLGAGKTTFMLHLLRDAKSRGLKIGVVINEFGDADIDGPILRDSGAKILGSLAGGCACCASQDEMIYAMLELGRLQGDARPDVVLLEASGLADPLVMLDGLTAAPLVPLVRVASVVAVVDALRLDELCDENARLAPILKRQIALADLLVVGKSDLAFGGEKSGEKAAAEATLRALNPDACLEFAREGAIELESFWGRVIRSDAAREAPESSSAAHGQAQTLVLPMPKPTSRQKLEGAFRACDANLWRAKGFVRIAGENDLFLLQYVGSGRSFSLERFEAQSLKAFPPAELVFIGPSLDEAAWRDALDV